MDDDEVFAVGVYRSAVTKDVVVGFSDGTVDELALCPGDVYHAAQKAMERSLHSSYPDGTDWYFSITAADFPEKGYDGYQDGDGEPPKGQEGNEESGGDDQADEGDQQEGESQGESQGESDQDGDEEMNFEDRDQTGEDEPIDNPFADELWEVYKPRVREIAHHYAEYGARYAMKHGGGGSGGGSGLTLKFEKGKVGKVEGVTHQMFPKVLAAVQRGVNVYLPGPPGTGKSHMVQQVAEALDIPFGVTSFSPMSTESKLLGFRSATGDTVRTVWRDRYEFGGGMLMDELDNANGAVIAVLNGGLANGFMEFPDGVVDRHKDFVCIATANTLGTGPTAEFAGRQKLDPATLNRFVKIFIDTDESMEDSIVRGMLGDTTADAWLKKVRHVRRAVADLRIKHFVTMRDSINGARLIAPGAGKFSQVEALHHTVLAVLPDETVDKIKKWRG
jgi:hypothetical protein